MSADILSGMSEKGEKLLWQGTAEKGGDERAKAHEPAVKSMYGAILKALLVPVIAATVVLAVILRLKAVIVLPFWAVIGVLARKYLSAEEWVYSITDRRMISGTEKSGAVSYSFEDISDISAYTGKDGIGCITFTSEGRECGLFGLADADEVYGILRENLPKDKFLE